MSWQVTYYNKKVRADILNWPSKLIAKYMHVIALIEQEGPNLGMPFTRSLGDKLFELRIKAKEGIGRAFFCTQINKEIIILHGFIKKSQKTPLKEIEIARERIKELQK